MHKSNWSARGNATVPGGFGGGGGGGGGGGAHTRSAIASARLAWSDSDVRHCLGVGRDARIDGANLNVLRAISTVIYI